MQIVRDDVFPLVNTILYVPCLALLLLGQISEAVISAGVVLLNAFISVIQEVRAKRARPHRAFASPEGKRHRSRASRTLSPSKKGIGSTPEVSVSQVVGTTVQRRWGVRVSPVN